MIDPVPCPMPECGAPLSLVTTIARSLTLADLLGTDRPTDFSSNPYTKDWFVGCDNHHVILLPGPTGYCGEDGDCGEDVDCSEDDRTFRTPDLARLGDLCVALNGIDRPHGP